MQRVPVRLTVAQKCEACGLHAGQRHSWQLVHGSRTTNQRNHQRDSMKNDHHNPGFWLLIAGNPTQTPPPKRVSQL